MICLNYKINFYTYYLFICKKFEKIIKIGGISYIDSALFFKRNSHEKFFLFQEIQDIGMGISHEKFALQIYFQKKEYQYLFTQNTHKNSNFVKQRLKMYIIN
jgi:hypothetical protein